MFRCEFSGEASEPAKHDYKLVEMPNGDMRHRLVTTQPAEKPVKLVIETRRRTYRNQEEELVEGSEIVREILVKPAYEHKARQFFGLEQNQ